MISLSQFRADGAAVEGLRAFLQSDTGIKVRRVLSWARHAELKAVPVRADEAASHLARLQGIERLATLLVEEMAAPLDVPDIIPPNSKLHDYTPVVPVAVMP